MVSFETQIKVVHHLVLLYNYFQKTKSFGGFRTAQYQDSGRLSIYNNLTVEPTADHHKYGFSIQSKSFRCGNICEDLLDTFWRSEKGRFSIFNLIEFLDCLSSNRTK